MSRSDKWRVCDLQTCEEILKTIRWNTRMIRAIVSVIKRGSKSKVHKLPNAYLGDKSTKY